jgi:membrane associated rhomboid family serine protease
MKRDNLYLFGVFLLVNSLVVIFFGYSNESITYNQQIPQTGWQLISTHFSHHSIFHYLGNMMGMYLLLMLFPGDNRTLILSFCLCIFLVSIYALFLKIDTFLGASALLYCIPGSRFAHQLIHNLNQALLILSILILFLFIITPMKYNHLETSFIPMTAAHVWGFIAGMIAYWFNLRKKSVAASNENI